MELYTKNQTSISPQTTKTINKNLNNVTYIIIYLQIFTKKHQL